MYIYIYLYVYICIYVYWYICILVYIYNGEVALITSKSRNISRLNQDKSQFWCVHLVAHLPFLAQVAHNVAVKVAMTAQRVSRRPPVAAKAPLVDDYIYINIYI